MINKKVSICIPSYKHTHFLKRSLDSIAIQTFKDFEIIISDDSPGDEIKNLLSHYPDLPILYHKNEISLGSPENWNYAIRLASGEYIKIMHHDDWFVHPDALQKFVDLLDQQPDVHFAFCAFSDIGKDKQYKRYPTLIELNYLKHSPDVLSLGNFIGPPSATIYRNHPDMYFDPALIWLVDIEFYIRYLRKYPGYAYTSQELVYIGISENQITNQCINNQELIRRENKYLFEKLHLKKQIAFQAYHLIRNVWVPWIKKRLGIKKRLL